MLIKKLCLFYLRRKQLTFVRIRGGNELNKAIKRNKYTPKYSKIVSFHIFVVNVC